MKITVQKRLAARLLKCSVKKIKMDASRVEDIKEAITKKDIRGLIKTKAITSRRTQHQSRGRARVIKRQKSRGNRKGTGSRKGTPTARLSKKSRWISKIRAQRNLLKEMRDEKKISTATYRDLYQKSKGGFFRSRRHITLYMEEHNIK